MSVTTKKKHVERELYEDFTLPAQHQTIVRVVKPRGNNLHQVTTADGEEFLVSMPHKFRKHVWIKRGDFVLTDPIPEGNKVRAEIVRILLKDHIRHLQQNDMWPDAFSQQVEEEKGAVNDRLETVKGESDRETMRGDKDSDRLEKDSEESDSDSDSDGLLMENPNRQIIYYEESSETESEEEDEDDEDEDSLTEDTNRLKVSSQDSDDEDGKERPKEND